MRLFLQVQNVLIGWTFLLTIPVNSAGIETVNYFCFISSLQKSTSQTPSVPRSRGPERISVTSAEAERIRSENGTFYTTAREFASLYGDAFAQMVASRIPPRGESTIVTAMGGAEHLGTLLETRLPSLVPDAKLNFLYVPLPTKSIDPWTVWREPNPGERIKRVGIGEVPFGYESGLPRSGHPTHVAETLDSRHVFASPHVFVVDTGVRGTTIEAVAHVSRQKPFPAHVEGMLLFKTKDVESSVPIFALNQVMKPPAGTTSQDLLKWAIALDHNNSNFSQMPFTLDAFQRSNELSSHASTPHFNYRATLQGLTDGLEHPREPAVFLQHPIPSSRTIPDAPSFASATPLPAEVRSFAPPLLQTLMDTTRPFHERQTAMGKLQAGMKTLSDRADQKSLQAIFDHVISHADRYSPSFGTQMQILRLPELLQVSSKRNQLTAGLGTPLVEFEDFLAIRGGAPSLPEEDIVAKVMHTSGFTRSLYGARNLEEYLAALRSPAEEKFKQRVRTFLPSFKKPLREVPIRMQDAADYMARLRSDGPAALTAIWKRLGLEKEFQQAYPTVDSFWASPKSFLEIVAALQKTQRN